MLVKLSKGTILSTGKNSLYKSTGWSHYSLLLETECTLEEKNRGNNIPVQSKTRLKCKFFLDILKQLKEKQKQRASTAPEVAAFGRWHKRRKILREEGNSRTTARSEHSRLRSTTTTYFRKPRKPKRICILYGKIAQIQSKKASKEEGEEREDVRPQRKISGNHIKSDYLQKRKKKKPPLLSFDEQIVQKRKNRHRKKRDDVARQRPPPHQVTTKKDSKEPHPYSISTNESPKKKTTESKEEGEASEGGTSPGELGGGEGGGGDEKGNELAQHQAHQSPLGPYLLPLLANRAAQGLGINDRHPSGQQQTSLVTVYRSRSPTLLPLQKSDLYHTLGYT